MNTTDKVLNYLSLIIDEFSEALKANDTTKQGWF